MKSQKTDYIFDVCFEDCLRKIQIGGDKSLYHFAEAITQAFGFDFDHCFGFYNNFKKYHDSDRAYEFFVDIGEESGTPTAKGVKKTKISKAFENPGEKMLFLFDYGDEWRFSVELKEIKRITGLNTNPSILECIGKAPEQYSAWEGKRMGIEMESEWKA